MADLERSAEQLFGEAVVLRPEQRTLFLEEACRNAPDLRRQVEQLLHDNQRRGSVPGKPLSTPDAPTAFVVHALSTASARFQPAQLIAGRFLIVRFIARGGMGEVYEAEDQFLQGVRIALKIIRPEIAADATTASRFEQEVILARRVVHPNLCPIYEIFRCEEPPPRFLLLTMKLLEGETLDARIKAPVPLSSSEAAEICRQLIAGVAALHAGNIVHRDLKPQNVMLEKTDKGFNVSIMDFGLARLNEAEATVFGSGMIAGTPGYLAPELLQGDRPSKASDLYALGIVLHQVLTGERPVQSTRGLSVKPSSSLQSGTTAPLLVQAVQSFLSTDPEQRCQAFERFQTGQGSGTGLVSSPPASSIRRRTLWYAGLGVFVLLASIAIITWWGHRRSATAPIRSLAVLSLKNLSGDPAQEYLAEGMTDELITELARIPDLRVVSSTSVRQLKGSGKTLQQIARALDVDAVVEGSVIRSADKMRVTAQLIDARADRHLWAQTFEEPANDVLALEDRVAREIASQAKAVLAPQQTRAVRQIDPAAQDDYLRGLFFLSQRDAKKSTAYFQSATAADPLFAQAYAGLSQALNLQGLMALEPMADMVPKALAAANRAIELAPERGEAYTARGDIEMFYERNWAAAEKDLVRGLALSPNNTLGEMDYSVFLAAMGRTDDAITHMRRALKLDPLSFIATRQLGSILFLGRHYDEALHYLQLAEEIDPAHIDLVKEWEMRVYEKKGMLAEAVDADLGDMEESAARSLRAAYRRGGWTAYQQSRIEVLKPHAHLPCFVSEVGESYVRIGDYDQAIDWLDRAVDQRCFWTLWLKVNPILDSLRASPRYHDLLRRANLPE